MKKMTVALLVVLSVGMSQAAAINWQSGNLMLPVGWDDGEKIYDGTWTSSKLTAGQAIGYYFVLTAAQYNSETLIADTAAAILGGTFDYSIADQQVSASGALNRVANWQQSGFDVGDSGYVLAVFLLEDYSGGTVGKETDWFIINKGAATIADNGANQTVANLAVNGGDWTPVPEPTATALLAIGVAILGLRRKARK